MSGGLRNVVRAAGAAALLLAHAAPAWAAVEKARVLTSPPADAFRAAWPAAAKSAGLGGRAAMACKVGPAGSLGDCRVAHEYPSTQGFGDALLKLAPQYHVNLTAPGAPAVGDVFVVEGDWYEQDKPANWLRKPSSTDLIAVYPTQAMKDGVDGSAILSCIVNLQGALSDCIAYDDKPKGAHFADAALALTPQFLMKPATLNGHPVLSVARIPINFKTFGRATGLELSNRVVAPAMIWANAPSYADVAAAYPAKARAAKVGGRVTLYCQFTSKGELRECHTVAQEPKGYGFEAAAMKLKSQFRAMTKPEGDKDLTKASIQLPITFDPALLEEGKIAVGKPDWATIPGPDDVKAAFANVPTSAGAVRAVLACSVAQGGSVTDCKVESETPAGAGAGSAAVALSSKFRLATWTSEGLPVVGGTVRIPLRYEPEPSPPAKP